MYISGRRHAPLIQEQEEIAKILGIDRIHRVGKRQAIYPSSPSVLKLLEYKDFLKTNDHVYVADLMCISDKHDQILATITAYHKHKVILHIYDIQYVDDEHLPIDEQQHKCSQYDLLRRYLESFRRMRRRQVTALAAARSRRGRKAEHIDDLSPDLYQLISRYCTDTSFSKKELLHSINDLGYRMGTGKIYRLIAEERARKGLPFRRQ